MRISDFFMIASGLVDRHGRRQLACLDLFEQQTSLLLNAGDNISSGNETQRRLLKGGDGHEGGAELRGSPPCWPFMLFHTAIVSVVRSA